MDQAQTREPPRIQEQYAPWRGVQVTDAELRVGDRTYQIAELRRLREQIGRPQPVRQVVLGVSVAQTVVTALAVAGLAYVNGWTPALVVVVAAQALATTVLVGVSLVRWPTPIELWALYRGELTMLYRNPDRYEFGKVRRAIERAMHARRLRQ